MKINGLLFFFLISFNSCKNHSQKDSNQISFFEKLVRIENELIGKRINSVSTVLMDSAKCYKVIYLITDGNCGNCLKEGFEIIKEIDSKKSIDNYVIGSNINFGLIQLQNDYKKWIFEDNDNLIRKELMFSLTPVVLFLDTSNVILDLYHPLSGYEQNDKLELFFNRVFIK